MKVIALTGANPITLHQVHTQLLQAITHAGVRASVLADVRNAHEAQAVYGEGGELWRVGDDDTKPELDVLIDRTLPDATPERLADATRQALHRFLNKTNIAPQVPA